MRARLQYCRSCGRHTLDLSCPDCGLKVTQAAPMKWSPEDRHGHLRRKIREESNPDWPASLPSLEEE